MSGDMLIARVAGERIAIAAVDIQTVIELGEVVPVPCAPVVVAGLAAQRSRTLTVIDVASAFGLPSRPDTARFAVVVEIAGVGYALAVDAVENVIPAIGKVQPVKVKLSQEWARSAVGMIDTAVGTVLLLDLTKLVGGEMQQKAT
jgi:purine-binding chemotaxis protein CheW